MNTFVYQCLFVVLIYTKSTHHYPTGAPTSACGTMVPGHGVSSQACAGNYILQSDKTQYTTGGTVSIMINSTSGGNPFRGVLIIAKTATSGQIVGTWSVTSSTLQTIACGGTANTGVTHTAGTDKTSVTAVWTPPSTIPTENIIIRATVVRTFSIVYVNCFSVTLTSGSSAQSTTTTTTTTTTATAAPSSGTTIAGLTTTAVSTTRNTVASTSSSTTTTTAAVSTTSSTTTTTTPTPVSNVGVDFSWTYANGVTSVSMKIGNLKTSQWLALGLSLDQKMGEDHVFMCKRLANDTVVLERRINPGGYSPPEIVASTSNEGGQLTITSQRLQDGTVYCEFTLSNFASGKRRRRDIALLSPSTSYYPLIATGDLDSSNEPMKHNSRSPLSQTVQLNQQESIAFNFDESSEPGPGLMKGHGILMIFTWILLASTGILSARYFKSAWPETKVCGKALWFLIHRTVMTSVVALTLISFILILVYTNGTWVSQNEGGRFAHSIIGIIIISFAVIQFIMSFFRCKPEAEYRFIFNYAHAFVGFSAFVLSIVAIFLTTFFSDFNFQGKNVYGIMIAWTLWVLVIFLGFWFVEFFFREDPPKTENADGYDLDSMTPVTQPAPNKNRVKKDRIKLALLVIHILVAFAISLALAIFVGNA